MDKIKKLLFNHKETIQLICIIVLYAIVNIVFNYRVFWHELIFDNSKVGAVYGEVLGAEWVQEQLYQNIISGRNPFTINTGMIYPFGTSFISTDSGIGFYLVFLRPLLSLHQAMSVIAAASFFLSNLAMYFFLRSIGRSKISSFFIGLAYGYMTFLMPRSGHLTYFATYVFPLFYLALVNFIKKKSTNVIRMVSAFFLSFWFVMTLYLNLYYFIMLNLSIGFFILYLILFDRNTLQTYIQRTFRFIPIIVISTLILLFPWLQILYQTYLFEGLPEGNGWGGAVQYSSDIFGYFIPSVYSKFLGTFSELIGMKFAFARGIFENFTYPGIIILFSYIVIFILVRKHKIKKSVSNFFKMVGWVSFWFWILTLGPFLHVLGKWGVPLEGVRVVFPLPPFILFHYIPFMNNIRSPGRLIVAFIFFSYILSAVLIDMLLKKIKYKGRIAVVLVLAAVFIIDQYHETVIPDIHFVPRTLYQIIKQDTEFSTVMQIPSSIRDGFIYFGDLSSLDYIEGQFIHNKPVLSGYFGRIPFYKIAYYQHNPFIGYIGRVTDENILLNGSVEQADMADWQKINKKNSLKALDFLDTKYVLLDTRKPYASSISATLKQLNFELKAFEETSLLYTRNISKREFTQVVLGASDDDIYLGSGWGDREKNSRWGGSKISVMFKLTNTDKHQLSFTARSFYIKRNVSIYVNRKKITTLSIDPNMQKHMVTVPSSYFKKGINTIYFLFDSSNKPMDVYPGNTDVRNLSAEFKSIGIQ